MGGAIIGLQVSKQDGMIFLFVPNMSKLSRSEPTYPHSIEVDSDAGIKRYEGKEYRA